MVNQHHGIGLMSGTSLDGLDIAYCLFEENEGVWKYNIEAACCVDFPSEIISKLKTAPSLNSEKLIKLDIDFGKWIGLEVNKFIKKQKINHEQLGSAYGVDDRGQVVFAVGGQLDQTLGDLAAGDVGEGAANFTVRRVQRLGAQVDTAQARLHADVRVAGDVAFGIQYTGEPVPAQLQVFYDPLGALPTITAPVIDRRQAA